MVLKPKKAKTVFESWKMVNNEKRKYKMEHQVKEVKLAQHCIQLTIAKNDNFSKTAITFLAYDSVC